MLEANYLSILLKPNFEKPIDSIEDILDRGLKLLLYPYSEAIVDEMENSVSDLTRRLAERTYVAKVLFIFLNQHLIIR